MLNRMSRLLMARTVMRISKPLLHPYKQPLSTVATSLTKLKVHPTSQRNNYKGICLALSVASVVMMAENLREDTNPSTLPQAASSSEFEKLVTTLKQCKTDVDIHTVLSGKDGISSISDFYQLNMVCKILSNIKTEENFLPYLESSIQKYVKDFYQLKTFIYKNNIFDLNLLLGIKAEDLSNIIQSYSQLLSLSKNNSITLCCLLQRLPSNHLVNLVLSEDAKPDRVIMRLDQIWKLQEFNHRLCLSALYFLSDLQLKQLAADIPTLTNLLNINSLNLLSSKIERLSDKEKNDILYRLGEEHIDKLLVSLTPFEKNKFLSSLPKSYLEQKFPAETTSYSQELTPPGP